jgi:2-polyprenyl-3-methyl-5-hydroxy-6-metoxy-1,4-benzoquinol methylase
MHCQNSHNKYYTVEEIQNLILSKIPENYYKIYAQYEQGYWSHIPKWILTKNIINCLDIGAGYGTLSLFTKINKNCNLEILDNKNYFNKDMALEYNINLTQCNIEKENPRYKTKFDMIIMTEIFEHFNFNPIDVLIKIKTLLTDDGVIMFSTPDALSWGKIDKYNDWKDIPHYENQIEYLDEHIYQYTLDELKDIFSVVGLKIEKYDTSINSSGFKHINLILSK